MLTKINYNNFDVYTEEIIHPEEFLKLYKKEKVAIAFETEVNNVDKKAFATFLAKERHSININDGDFIIFRAVKGKNKFEFISQTLKWGKFHIPKIVIETLSFNNHESIRFEVVRCCKNEETTNKLIDLSNLQENVIVLFRENNLVTLVKKSTIPITLPRFIEITPDLIELFYLIHGDGHYATKLYFVNKDVELIRFVMDKFEEILRIPKETWRARLLFNHQSDAEIAKKKWQTSLNLKDEQFYPSISKCVLNTSDKGNLRIVIDKLIVACVFRNVFDKLQNPRGKDALYALNGLLCAEGSVDINYKGLHRITLSFSQKEKDMFQKILCESKIDTLSNVLRDRFTISKWGNFYQFFKIFLRNNITPFSLHRSRCNNALQGFIDHSFTQTMIKYLAVIKNKDKLDTTELNVRLNHKSNSTLKTLKKEKYQKFINLEGKGGSGNSFKVSITREGREFLSLVENIQEIYNEQYRFG
ncbi:MAG: hypothetical protein Q8L29_00220 [archaeon]|nr:hypothetical protein [archaeon]